MEATGMEATGMEATGMEATGVADARQAIARLLVRLLGAFENLDEAPALVLADRPRLHDENRIAFTGRVLFVVSHHSGGALEVLAVHRVLHLSANVDRDGLVHLVAHHDADAFFARIPLVVTGVDVSYRVGGSSTRVGGGICLGFGRVWGMLHGFLKVGNRRAQAGGRTSVIAGGSPCA